MQETTKVCRVCTIQMEASTMTTLRDLRQILPRNSLKTVCWLRLYTLCLSRTRPDVLLTLLPWRKSYLHTLSLLRLWSLKRKALNLSSDITILKDKCIHINLITKHMPNTLKPLLGSKIGLRILSNNQPVILIKEGTIPWSII